MLGVGAAAGILVMHFGMLKYMRVPLSVRCLTNRSSPATISARTSGHGAQPLSKPGTLVMMTVPRMVAYVR